VSKVWRTWLVMSGVLVLAVMFGSASQAVVTGRIGGVADRQYFASEDTAWTTTSATWVNVPGSWGTVNVSGSDQMIDARFMAETMCENAFYCTVRIIVQNNTTGWWTELYPVSGSDFAFDSPGGSWEAHAMERFSDFLPAGPYTVRVQAAVVAAGTGSFRLDDRTLVVALTRP
jgi:hypothetical protein